MTAQIHEACKANLTTTQIIYYKKLYCSILEALSPNPTHH